LGLMAGFDLEEIERLYEELPSVIFSKSVSNWGRFLWSVGDAYYDPTPLETCLQNFFKEKTFEDIKNGPKCFVVAAEVSQTSPSPYLLRNYVAPMLYNSKSLVGNFVIPPGAHDTNYLDVPLWVAARATSAPTYFPPFVYEDCKFADGGLVANCPIEFAVQEALALNQDITFSYIISLGTGSSGMIIQLIGTL